MLTKDEYEQLPEKARAAFVQDGEQFVPAKDAKLKQTLNDLDNKYRETSAKLTEYESRQQQQQAEAERKALEKLKAEGKVDEILADADRRIGESAKAYEERIAKMTEVAKSGRRDEIISDLSSYAADKFKPAFKKLAAQLVDYDPLTGKEIYFNEDGSASSATNRAEFLREVLQKSDTFEMMLKGSPTTTGGGLANGNSSGSALGMAGKVDGSKNERAAYYAKKFKLSN